MYYSDRKKNIIYVNNEIRWFVKWDYKIKIKYCIINKDNVKCYLICSF